MLDKNPSTCEGIEKIIQDLKSLAAMQKKDLSFRISDKDYYSQYYYAQEIFHVDELIGNLRRVWQVSGVRWGCNALADV